ncbi:MAG: MATE family efflux transporter [Oscillospiraceae bacterium]|nr:MATE family efflux transporter [Oscillospiraceae bacterium]
MEHRVKNSITEGVIWKEMILFLIPIFLQSVFQQVFGIADAIIVGQGVGKYALGAINSTSNLTRLFLNLFLGFCSGSAIVVSQGWGAENPDRVRRAVHTGMAFSLTGGLLTALICVPATPLFMKLMQIPADMLPYSQIYTRIIYVSFIGVFIYDMAAAILRAIGDSKRPFYYLIAAMLLNVVLDLAFVLVFRWGVAGAAAATAVSQMAAALLAVRRLCRADNAARLTLKDVRFDPKTLREITRLGVPMGISGILFSISNITIQSTVNSLGTDVLTGWGVNNKICSLIWSMFETFAIAASTFVAQNYGAGKLDRVRKTIRTCFALESAVIVPVSVMLYVFVRPLSRLFINDEAVMNYAVLANHVMVPFYFVYLFGDLFGASIRGTGETLRPMLITLVGICGFRVVWIVAIHLVSAPTVLNVAVSYPASWIFNSALMTLYFFFGRWRSRLREPEAAQ